MLRSRLRLPLHLHSTVQSVPIQMMDMSGQRSVQHVHSRIFDNYELKSLVLLLQPHGLLISSWEAFAAIHRPDNIYQLVRRVTRNTAAFSVAKALCESAMSPFILDHRVNPYDFRLNFREGDSPALKQFNESEAGKRVSSSLSPSNIICFDGILSAPEDAAFILTAQSHSERMVLHSVACIEFVKQFVSSGVVLHSKLTHIRDQWRTVVDKRRHIVCAADSVPSPAVLQLGATHGVYIYSKRGCDYVFCPPPAQHPQAAASSAASSPAG